MLNKYLGAGQTERKAGDGHGAAAGEKNTFEMVAILVLAVANGTQVGQRGDSGLKTVVDEFGRVVGTIPFEASDDVVSQAKCIDERGAATVGNAFKNELLDLRSNRKQ